MWASKWLWEAFLKKTQKIRASENARIPYVDFCVTCAFSVYPGVWLRNNPWTWGLGVLRLPGTCFLNALLSLDTRTLHPCIPAVCNNLSCGQGAWWRAEPIFSLFSPCPLPPFCWFIRARRGRRQIFELLVVILSATTCAKVGVRQYATLWNCDCYACETTHIHPQTTRYCMYRFDICIILPLCELMLQIVTFCDNLK